MVEAVRVRSVFGLLPTALVGGWDDRFTAKDEAYGACQFQESNVFAGVSQSTGPFVCAKSR